MQVSLYIEDRLVKALDRHAKKRNKTRSAFLQHVLKTHLLQQPESVFDEVFGILKPSSAEKLLEKARLARKNSSRFE